MNRLSSARLALLALSVPLALSACAEPIGDRTEVDETPIPVEPDGGIGDGAAPLDEMAETRIPSAFHGRWDSGPAACLANESNLQVTIDERTIEFYESSAAVSSVAASEGPVFRATYDFTGEGEQWTRDIQLALNEEGTELTRTEYGEDALAEPLTYTKCQA